MKNIASESNNSKLSNIKEGDVQPNAVDLRLDKIFEINDSPFILSEEQKLHRGSSLIEPDVDGYFRLKQGSYEITFQNIVTIAEGDAGFVITRSTLNRNGVFITSGLYDSGYEGVMVKRGTRLGQFLLFDAEALSMYDGSYGLTKEHDKKYV